MTDTQNGRPLDQARERVRKLRESAEGELRQELDAIDRLLEEAAQTNGADEVAELRARLDESCRRPQVHLGDGTWMHPLTSIKGYTDMLAKHVAGPLNEMQQQFAETVRSNVSRMESLIADVSDASKLYAGRIKLDPKLETYKNIAQKVEKDVAELAAAREQTLTFETPNGLPLLNVDGERLAQALRKLVTNAIQYTPEGGEITVKAEAVNGGRLKVSVIDNGIGMAPDELAHVGERFWRSEDERVREVKGHGLGLHRDRADRT